MVPVRLRNGDKLRNLDKILLNCVRIWHEWTRSVNLFYKVERTIVNFELKDTLEGDIPRGNGRFLRGQEHSMANRMRFSALCANDIKSLKRNEV